MSRDNLTSQLPAAKAHGDEQENLEIIREARSTGEKPRTS
jgi:hypothetical protein